jgi:hypothetical protein
MGPGDGTLPADGSQWACENWDYSQSPLVCIDVLNPHLNFGHYPMTYNRYVHELLYNSTIQKDWAVNKNGKTIVKAPFVQFGKGNSIILRPDIREISSVEFL